MNNRRRSFRSRHQKNNFRRKNISAVQKSSIVFNQNGNKSFGRNGSMNNIHNVEKMMQKFQQLAKDAQSSGDPVLAENYLQHADHYFRRFKELSEKSKETAELKLQKNEEKTNQDENNEKKLQQTAN